MNHSDEFGRFDLAIGTVRGLRSFGISDDGHLTGVTHRDPWVAGENHATCHRRWVGTCQCGSTSGTSTISTGSGHVFYVNLGAGEHANGCNGDSPCAPDDLMPTADCACGFYAYYEGSNDYARPEHVSGVVEGYGRTVVGSRGFRTQKARILALYWPEPKTAEETADEQGLDVVQPEPWEFGPHDRVWWWGSLAAVYAGLAAWSAIAGAWWVVAADGGLLAWAAWSLRDIRRARVAHRTGKSIGRSTLRVARAMALYELARMQTASNRARAATRTAWTSSWSTGGWYSVGIGPAGADITPDQAVAIRSHYPDVPVYHDLAAMLADFPLGDTPATTPAAPVPAPKEND